jgi:hypothetical protein
MKWITSGNSSVSERLVASQGLRSMELDTSITDIRPKCRVLCAQGLTEKANLKAGFHSIASVLCILCIQMLQADTT